MIERTIDLSDNEILSEEDILRYINTDSEGRPILDNKLIPIFVGDNFEDIERRVIETTYRECDYNQRKTADLLGITDRTIRNKLRRYREEDSKRE